MKIIRGSILSAAALALLALLLAPAALADDENKTTLKARLSGFGEVPPKLVDGRGTFSGTLSGDGQSISWTLKYTGLTGAAGAAHIHFGQAQNTGGVVIFFCGGGGKPACPATTDATITGTWTAADVQALPAQNVTAGDWAGFLKILRSGLSYANAHTTLFGAGEIRGQVSFRSEDHDDD